MGGGDYEQRDGPGKRRRTTIEERQQQQQDDEIQYLGSRPALLGRPIAPTEIQYLRSGPALLGRPIAPTEIQYLRGRPTQVKRRKYWQEAEPSIRTNESFPPWPPPPSDGMSVPGDIVRVFFSIF